MTETVFVPPAPNVRSRLLEAAAAEWHVRPRTMLAIWAAPAAVLLAAVAAALVGKSTYKLLVSEDRVYESFQVLLYAGGIFLAALIAVRLRRSDRRALALLYAALTLFLVFMVGEELSWGQRIFGYEGAAALVENNKQGESNIHNVEGVGVTFKWVQLLVGMYGVLLPLALRRWRSDFLSWLVPPLSIVPFFAVLIPWRLYRNLFDPPASAYFAVEEFSEAVELVLACGGFAFLVFQLRRLKREERS